MSSKRVIDNFNGNDLSSKLNEVLPDCISAKFGIGYFFLSGLKEIIDGVSGLEELKLLANQLNLNSNVTFTGEKNPADLKLLYKSSNIFVYPSLYENFGQPLIEAAAHGLPLISTPVGSQKT